MSKTSVLALVWILSGGLLLVPVTSAHADHHGDRGYLVDSSHKLARGLSNVLWSPVEISVNSYKESVRADDARANWGQRSVALFTGFFGGVAYMVARIGVGAFDIATFPLPTSPLMQPSAPRGFAETVGPHGPSGVFAVSGRINERSRKSRLDWDKPGASEDDFYRDRYDCAQRALYSGFFNECMEDLGWLARGDRGF